MTRPTPICHRTLAAIPGTDGDGNSISFQDLRPCLGSRCAMWADSSPGVDAVVDGKKVVHAGCCGDNRYFDVETWPDPAAEVKP